MNSFSNARTLISNALRMPKSTSAKAVGQAVEHTAATAGSVVTDALHAIAEDGGPMLVVIRASLLRARARLIAANSRNYKACFSEATTILRAVDELAF